MPHELRGFPSRPFGSAVTRVLGGGGDDDLRGEALGDLEPGVFWSLVSVFRRTCDIAPCTRHQAVHGRVFSAASTQTPDFARGEL